MGALSGESIGASFHVPAMLANIDIPGGPKSHLRGLRFHAAGSEDVAGVSCMKVSSEESDVHVSLWIAKSDFSLRRIRQVLRYERSSIQASNPDSAVGRPSLEEFPHEVEVEIYYSPNFDGVLDARLFEFTPPAPNEGLPRDARPSHGED